MKCGHEKVVVAKGARVCCEGARHEPAARKSVKRTKTMTVAPRKAERARAWK